MKCAGYITTCYGGRDQFSSCDKEATHKDPNEGYEYCLMCLFKTHVYRRIRNGFERIIITEQNCDDFLIKK